MNNYLVKEKLRNEENLVKDYKNKSNIYTLGATILLIICSICIFQSFEKWTTLSWWFVIIAGCSIIVITILNRFRVVVDKLFKIYSDGFTSMSKDILNLEKEQKNLILTHEKKEKNFQATIQSKTPFRIVSTIYSDWYTSVFEEAESYLANKSRPAIKAAETISEFRLKTNEAIRARKEMEYKYRFLLDAFPELKQYVDDEESLLHLSDYKNYEEFSDTIDHAQDWLTKEEYQRLSEDDRNQLALDRFKKRNKSKWEVGMEYELYIGYLLRQKNYSIRQFGIEKGLNDLGRDIIAEKAHLDGRRTIYIIQCKNWSKEKILHENIICQLFGTTLEYKIRHQNYYNTTIIPLLVTTTKLSDTAMEFAKKLGVEVRIEPIGEYPMIKLNIDSKIYHLPFDQQYYSTKIIPWKGEKYVWTVKEAVDLGYRRAMRWNGNK